MDNMILNSAFQEEEDWPNQAESMYERIEVLGKGSFGLVWMCRRKIPPMDDYDDEYVALKNIEIKEEKGKVYAQREISILSELKHPNVIRLIRAFPIYNNTSRLVALQLARGPNLQRVVSKRGAVGLPLARLLSRQLVAAVSYLHGRAVIHRDIKPTNLILENTESSKHQFYDYSRDMTIWSDGEDAKECVARGKWRVMLVDFGFARALEEREIQGQPRHLRNSIALEQQRKAKVTIPTPSDAQSNDSDSALDDMELIQQTAEALRTVCLDPDIDPNRNNKRVSFVSYNLDGIDEGNDGEPTKKTSSPTTTTTTTNNNNSQSQPSDSDVEGYNNNNTTTNGTVSSSKGEGGASREFRGSFLKNRRQRMSTTKQKVRSMSALGTKAYAAPEIKHQLRNKTQADVEKRNAALTECVADYGMIVDAYSVGWTLRVILTGVPPNCTISQYMRKHYERDIPEEIEEVGCCCFGGGGNSSSTLNTNGVSSNTKNNNLPPPFRVRDTDEMPRQATLFISALTQSNPEDRLSIREAQLHSWIRGDEGTDEPLYEVTQGDYPSHHGDPVVPLKCAGELSRIVEQHHQ